MKIVEGCIVKMSPESGCIGYGNLQCVSDVCEPLGTLSLYGHNLCYKIWDVEKVVSYPPTEELTRLRASLSEQDALIREAREIVETAYIADGSDRRRINKFLARLGASKEDKRNA